MDYVKIPRDFCALHKFVTLTADVMVVNGLAVVITFGRGVGLITVEFTPTHTAKKLAWNLTKVLLQTILMDMEFD